MKEMNSVILHKDDQIAKKQVEIDDIDKRLLDLEREKETLEIKKSGLERQFEQTKKGLNEKIDGLTQILDSEKETRTMWIERYEQEHKEHTTANAQLLESKSENKDQLLESKNLEIKLKNANRQVELMTIQNKKFQD